MDRERITYYYSEEQKKALRCLSIIEGKKVNSIISECIDIGIKKKSSKCKEKFEVVMNALNVCSETGSGC